MKKILTLLLFICAFSGYSQAKKKANIATEQWRYELECAGTGTDGTYLVKVWSYSKKGNVAIEQAKKNAVHGIIFKGVAGSGRTCNSQKALARDSGIEDKEKDFFKMFFADGGNYMKYVSVSTDGGVHAKDRMKVGKEYKIGVIVSVMKDALRKELEEAGIIRSLSSGF
ncbi:MAG TPA: hypothetical protein VFF21_03325 [Flavobacteriaceae bacterium]|nr:hypothetical protein [Flavobacteriaceae bacterium]